VLKIWDKNPIYEIPARHAPAERLWLELQLFRVCRRAANELREYLADFAAALGIRQRKRKLGARLISWYGKGRSQDLKQREERKRMKGK
jgi:hypothetical protein